MADFNQDTGEGSVGIAGAVTALRVKAVGGVVTISGSLNRKIAVAIGGTVSIAGSLNRKIFTAIGNGSVAIAGSINFLLKKAIGSGSVSIAGSVSSIKKIFKAVGEGVITSITGLIYYWTSTATPSRILEPLTTILNALSHLFTFYNPASNTVSITDACVAEIKLYTEDGIQMNTFQYGETVVIKAVIRDTLTGELIDPATSVKCTVKSPDGTLCADGQNMTNDAVGYYHYDYQTVSKAQLGKYKASVKSTDGTRISIDNEEFMLEEA